MTQCNHGDCTNNVFGTTEQCALHCAKNEYSRDFQSGLLRQFYEEFGDYLVAQLFENNYNFREEFTEDEIARYLKSDDRDFFDQDDSKLDALKSQLITPTGIVFPNRNIRDGFDYKKVLNLFGEIHFDGCEFNIYTLDLKGIACFFQDCVFHNRWMLRNYKVLSNVDGVLYQMCDFREGVDCGFDEEGELSEKQFCFNCKFKNISLYRTVLNQPLFWDEQGNQSRDGLIIENFTIEKCVFKEKLIINNHQIQKLHVLDSLFQGKFEFKNNKLSEFKVENTNFEQLVDCFSSNFQKFLISKSIFDNFVGFENCHFSGQKSESMPVFRYATFLNFVNFRRANFEAGLDLENINLKEPPNFLNCSINREKTNRETLRIIKHSFEKSGNSIDGGKYFSFEMAKYQEELSTKSWKGNTQEKVIFFANKWMSDFGQNFLLPVMWIFIFSLMFQVVIYVDGKNVVLNCVPWLKDVYSILNDLAKNIVPFARFLKSGMEFISLVFYVLFAVLIWQTIASVKMHTKRN